jgi:uncharacterized protein YndB with AHSA1/START domain
MKNKAVVTKVGERELHIERIFDAPRDRVWLAMTDPALLAQWWGRGNRLTIERLEVRRGGHWRFVEHSDHGDHGFEGRFGEVDPPSLIEMTFEWDGLPAHVVFQTQRLEELPDGRTKIVIDSLYLTGADRDGMIASGMEGGMNQSYAALDALLAKL